METSLTLESLHQTYSGPLTLKPAKLEDVKKLTDVGQILKKSPTPNAMIVSSFLLFLKKD